MSSSGLDRLAKAESPRSTLRFSVMHTPPSEGCSTRRPAPMAAARDRMLSIPRPPRRRPDPVAAEALPGSPTPLYPRPRRCPRPAAAAAGDSAASPAWWRGRRTPPSGCESTRRQDDRTARSPCERKPLASACVENSRQGSTDDRACRTNPAFPGPAEAICPLHPGLWGASIESVPTRPRQDFLSSPNP